MNAEDYTVALVDDVPYIVPMQPTSELRWSKSGVLEQKWATKTPSGFFAMAETKFEWRPVPTEGEEGG